MALTDNCDLYLAFGEDGANRVIRHIMRQRPSWFNYATADVAANREWWCNPKLSYTRDVVTYGNPIFKIEPPLPILGADAPPIAIGFCAQLTEARMDFHPGGAITLPPQLGTLPEQRFALELRVCAGLTCADDKELEQIPIGTTGKPTNERPPQQKVIVLRGKPLCFCIDVFVTGHFEHTGGNLLLGRVDGVEIVDIKPDRLESNLECYLRMAVTAILREKLAISYSALAMSFPLLDIATITLSPTGNPPVPHNPAIEDDQLKAFITMAV